MNKLTETVVREAAIREKQYKIYDGDGMFLLVHPNGSKYWRMKYTFDSKSKLASFGVWPGVSLKEAREIRYDARQKIKRGINPVEEKRKNKQHQEKRTTDKVNSESFQYDNSVNQSFQWSKLLYPHGKFKETEVSYRLLKSCIFEKNDMKSFSLADKKELNEILSRISRNRSVLYEIIWEFYLSFPILNIAVLFLLLLIVMDFFPALLTTVIYLILTVCTAVAFGLWHEKKVRE